MLAAAPTASHLSALHPAPPHAQDSNALKAEQRELKAALKQSRQEVASLSARLDLATAELEAARKEASSAKRQVDAARSRSSLLEKAWASALWRLGAACECLPGACRVPAGCLLGAAGGRSGQAARTHTHPACLAARPTLSCHVGTAVLLGLARAARGSSAMCLPCACVCRHVPPNSAHLSCLLLSCPVVP